MNTAKWQRVFFLLTCLTLMLTLTIGRTKASPVQQADADFAAIDAYITEQMKDLGIPGMALGIVEDGEIVHLKGFGAADSSGRAVTPQTPFYVGSVSKSFAALSVMQLVEEGKIDLDAPVQTYLPWFELADKEASAQITVRHLLNQTTGISERDGNRFWTSQQGAEEFAQGLDTVQLTRPVGTTYQYCNVNFILAGLIVEAVSGQSYADYVTQHIFEPLDMRHSYASRDLALTDGLSEGHYYLVGRAFRDERVMPPVLLSAGGLMLSAEDLSHYAIAQLNDGRYGDASVLSPQGIAELHTPAIPEGGTDQHYAMGWNVGSWDGVTYFAHAGDVGNFHATILLLPESDQGIVVLSNASGFVQIAQGDQISVGVANLLTHQTPPPISLSFLTRFLYWTILLMPLLQIAGIILVWRNRQRMKLWAVVLTVVLNLVIVFGLLALSRNIPFPLPSMRVFYPELAHGLIVVIVLGIGWSVVYTAMTLIARRGAR